MENTTQLILVINPGSTSTKVGIFNGSTLVLEQNLHHSNEDLAQFDVIIEQIEFRSILIKQFITENNYSLNDFSVIMARGGMIKPLKAGVYEVNESMIHDLKTTPKHHASNLAGLIANDLIQGLDMKAYIADPVVVDELADVARLTGHPLFPKASIFHALNQKSVAKRFANEQGKKYEDLNLIVAHLGGGISVGAHKKGRVIEVNQALDGDGPFSPERSGNLPMGDVIKLAYSGKYSEKELHSMIVGKGGVSAYLNTNDMRVVEDLAAKGDEKATAVLTAMAYQIAKEIGALSVVLEGDVDGIVLTGGVAYTKYLTEYIAHKTKFIAATTVYAGEDELLALAQNGVAVLADPSVSLVY